MSPGVFEIAFVETYELENVNKRTGVKITCKNVV